MIDLLEYERKETGENYSSQNTISHSAVRLQASDSSLKPARRSRRYNRGQHWKFAYKLETSPEMARSGESPLQPGEDSSESPASTEEEPCAISLALEAFAKEEEECKVTPSQAPEHGSSVESNAGGSGPKRQRKRRRQQYDDNSSDPDDPSMKDMDGGEDKFVPPDQLPELTRPYIGRKSATASRSRRGGDDSSADMYQCSKCGYSRREETALVEHVATHHLNVWTLKCLVCGQLERAVGRMELHLNTQHQLTREADKAAEGSYRLVTSDECTVDILPERFRWDIFI